MTGQHVVLIQMTLSSVHRSLRPGNPTRENGFDD